MVIEKRLASCKWPAGRVVSTPAIDFVVVKSLKWSNLFYKTLNVKQYRTVPVTACPDWPADLLTEQRHSHCEVPLADCPYPSDPSVETRYPVHSDSPTSSSYPRQRLDTLFRCELNQRFPATKASVVIQGVSQVRNPDNQRNNPDYILLMTKNKSLCHATKITRCTEMSFSLELINNVYELKYVATFLTSTMTSADSISSDAHSPWSSPSVNTTCVIMLEELESNSPVGKKRWHYCQFKFKEFKQTRS